MITFDFAGETKDSALVVTGKRAPAKVRFTIADSRGRQFKIGRWAIGTTDSGEVRDSTYELTVSAGDGLPKVGRLLVVPTVLVKKPPPVRDGDAQKSGALGPKPAIDVRAERAARRK